MALLQLKEKLPYGPMGRIINSFIFYEHQDAIAEAREYRTKQLLKAPPLPFTLGALRCLRAVFELQQTLWWYGYYLDDTCGNGFPDFIFMDDLYELQAVLGEEGHPLLKDLLKDLEERVDDHWCWCAVSELYSELETVNYVVRGFGELQ